MNSCWLNGHKLRGEHQKRRELESSLTWRVKRILLSLSLSIFFSPSSYVSETSYVFTFSLLLFSLSLSLTPCHLSVTTLHSYFPSRHFFFFFSLSLSISFLSLVSLSSLSFDTLYATFPLFVSTRKNRPHFERMERTRFTLFLPSSFPFFFFLPRFLPSSLSQMDEKKNWEKREGEGDRKWPWKKVTLSHQS